MSFLSLTNISATLIGFGYERQYRFFHELERDSVHSSNRYRTSLFQGIQFIFLSQQLSALKFTNYSHNQKIVMGTISLLGIAAIGYLGSSYDSLSIEDRQKNTKKIYLINLLHRHIGFVCKTASLIAVIALFRSGNRLFAYGYFSSILLDYAAKSKRMPSKIRHIYNQYIPFVFTAIQLYSGSKVIKILSLVEMIGQISKRLFPLKNLLPFDQTCCHHLTDYHQFIRIFNNEVELEVNRDHVNISVLPLSTTINFEQLRELGQTVDWENEENKRLFEESFNENISWKNYLTDSKSVSENKNESLSVRTNYVKKNVNDFIECVQTKCHSTEKSEAYTTMRSYLADITEKLPFASEEIQKQVILTLIKANNHQEDYKIVYHLYQIVHLLDSRVKKPQDETHTPINSLKFKILKQLQNQRNEIMTYCHKNIGQLGIPSYFYMLRDEESAYHVTTNLIASDFNLSDQGASQDPNAQMPFILKNMMMFTINLNPRFNIWKELNLSYPLACQGYTKERIVNACQAAIKCSYIEKSEVTQWAEEWIENTNASPDDKRQFLAHLKDGVYCEKSTKFKEAFIAAMLVDMGILKQKT